MKIKGKILVKSPYTKTLDIENKEYGSRVTRTCDAKVVWPLLEKYHIKKGDTICADANDEFVIRKVNWMKIIPKVKEWMKKYPHQFMLHVKNVERV